MNLVIDRKSVSNYFDDRFIVVTFSWKEYQKFSGSGSSFSNVKMCCWFLVDIISTNLFSLSFGVSEDVKTNIFHYFLIHYTHF